MGADLITLDDYKLIEGVNNSKDDEKLEALITSVSQLIKTYCSNDFVDSYASPGNTEYFDIQWDTYVVQLSKTPVVAITGVFERSSQSENYTEIFRDGNGSPAEYSWYFDSVSESIFRTNESGTYKCFPKGVGSVQVTYTSGYATIPEDLKLAVVDTVTYYHKDEHKKRQSIGATTRESIATSTRINDTSFPDHIKRVLDLYRLF
jgi:hypothetical protein